MECKTCGSDVNKKTEICTNCMTDNHDYTLDWMRDTASFISGISDE